MLFQPAPLRAGCGQCSADIAQPGAQTSAGGEAYLPVLDVLATGVKDPTSSAFWPLLSGYSKCLRMPDGPF